MAFFKVLYMLSIVLTPIKGDCPSIDDMPVMYGDTFACSQWWMENSHSPYSVDSCKGLLRDSMCEFDHMIIILQAKPINFQTAMTIPMTKIPYIKWEVML